MGAVSEATSVPYWGFQANRVLVHPCLHQNETDLKKKNLKKSFLVFVQFLLGLLLLFGLVYFLFSRQ